MMLQFTEPFTKGVFKIGDQTLLKKNSTSKPTGFYTFIQNLGKEAELIVDNVPFILQSNCIISLTPDQYFSCKQIENCNVYQFNRDFYCIKDHDKELNCMGVIFHSNTQIPIAFLDTDERTRFHTIYIDLLEEFENKDSIQAEMLLVETHFRKEHQVSFYADQLFKSAKTLSNTFNTLSTSPLLIIHNRIILETKRLLMYSELSLKEIAIELGFSETSNLSKLFKKKVGESPATFKKRQITQKGKN